MLDRKKWADESAGGLYRESRRRLFTGQLGARARERESDGRK